MIALSWSGGKDCARALERLRETQSDPVLLLTTVDDAGAVSHHGVPRELLRAQAAATGLELAEIVIPRGADNRVYGERMAAAFAREPLSHVSAVAFGDLFLGDLRAFRERRLAEIGVDALFPLWSRDTHELAAEIIARGYVATVVSIDPGALDAGVLGRRFDAPLLAELPAQVDPCGERGEFHTFVSNGPVFASPVEFATGDAYELEGFPRLALTARAG